MKENYGIWAGGLSMHNALLSSLMFVPLPATTYPFPASTADSKKLVNPLKLPIGAKILTPPSNTISPGSQDTNDSSTV